MKSATAVIASCEAQPEVVMVAGLVAPSQEDPSRGHPARASLAVL